MFPPFLFSTASGLALGPTQGMGMGRGGAVLQVVVDH
jgi:hypothetical protein